MIYLADTEGTDRSVDRVWGGAWRENGHCRLLNCQRGTKRVDETEGPGKKSFGYHYPPGKKHERYNNAHTTTHCMVMPSCSPWPGIAFPAALLISLRQTFHRQFFPIFRFPDVPPPKGTLPVDNSIRNERFFGVEIFVVYCPCHHIWKKDWKFGSYQGIIDSFREEGMQLEIYTCASIVLKIVTVSLIAVFGPKMVGALIVALGSKRVTCAKQVLC